MTLQIVAPGASFASGTWRISHYAPTIRTCNVIGLQSSKVHPRKNLGDGDFHGLQVQTAVVDWIQGTMTAQETLQRFLDDVALALASGNSDRYRACVELPLLIVTSAATLLVRTEDELVEGFDELSDMLCCRGATEIRLSELQARFDGHDRLIGVYESRYLCDGRPLVPTFYSRIWLVRRDGAWRATRVHNTTSETRWPILLTRMETDQGLPMEFMQ